MTFQKSPFENSNTYGPYGQVLELCTGKGLALSGGYMRLALLVISLYNGRTPITGQTMGGWDYELRVAAKMALTHFIDFGPDRYLIEAGRELLTRYESFLDV